LNSRCWSGFIRALELFEAHHARDPAIEEGAGIGEILAVVVEEKLRGSRHRPPPASSAWYNGRNRSRHRPASCHIASAARQPRRTPRGAFAGMASMASARRSASRSGAAISSRAVTSAVMRSRIFIAASASAGRRAAHAPVDRGEPGVDHVHGARPERARPATSASTPISAAARATRILPPSHRRRHGPGKDRRDLLAQFIKGEVGHRPSIMDLPSMPKLPPSSLRRQGPIHAVPFRSAVDRLLPAQERRRIDEIRRAGA
jgi:hypothetical protein